MRHMVRDSLIRHGYTLKERAKVYSYATTGAVLPLIMTRYGCSIPRNISDDSELASWIASAGLSLIPSIMTAFLGLFAGAVNASFSRIKKFEKQKQSQLENSVKGAEK